MVCWGCNVLQRAGGDSCCIKTNSGLWWGNDCQLITTLQGFKLGCDGRNVIIPTFPRDGGRGWKTKQCIYLQRVSQWRSQLSSGTKRKSSETTNHKTWTREQTAGTVTTYWCIILKESVYSMDTTVKDRQIVYIWQGHPFDLIADNDISTELQ